MKLIAQNRKARHDYHIVEQMEAGIVLTGTEVKSCRAGQVSLTEAHARVGDGELWLHGANIAIYEQGNRLNHEPTRSRKLLVHRREIRHLKQAIEAKGMTLVPLSFYFNKGKIKVELALCRGKAKQDKRETLKRRIHNLEAQRAMGKA